MYLYSNYTGTSSLLTKSLWNDMEVEGSLLDLPTFLWIGLLHFHDKPRDLVNMPFLHVRYITAHTILHNLWLHNERTPETLWGVYPRIESRQFFVASPQLELITVRSRHPKVIIACLSSSCERQTWTTVTFASFITSITVTSSQVVQLHELWCKLSNLLHVLRAQSSPNGHYVACAQGH